MTMLNQISVDEFKEILDEYVKNNDHQNKLSKEEAAAIAEKLNGKIDIPIIGEERENKLLLKIVNKIDVFLYENLPNEIYALIRSTEDGISEEEVKTLASRLSKLANEKINIPYLTERMEYLAIRMVIGFILRAATKNWDMSRSSSSDSPHRSIFPDDFVD